MAETTKKTWRKPELRTIKAGAAETGGKNLSDGKGASLS